ncbi:polysaccharide lyase family 8 super-sandwich domain-containing protein [Paenibacillus oryzisoli]|uniref:polysaccharide lyase family 8 super-sandwich domain-containing protein n=1 Tax=Paenibacillus oryzisoli TaxID=1850517 RepID=UPI003D2B4A78
MLINMLAQPLTPPAHAADVTADEYDMLRARMYDMLTGGPDYDPADPVIAEKIASITTIAQNNWDTMDKSDARAYLWSDLAATTESEHVSGSYQRLEAMTLAYATRGSSLEHNAALLADIISAMDWMYVNRFNKSVVYRGYDNWFDWQISSPLSINNITTMIYSSLTSTQIANWHEVIDYQALAWGAGLTGANRVWACNIKISSGIIVKDSTKIIEGRDQLSSVFDYVTSGEGMYSDGSFLQHTALIAYNGGYGINLIDNLTKVMYIITGSSWDITDPDVNNIYQWVYTAFEPLFYNNSMFDMVRGRNMSRKANDDNGATSMGALGAAVVRMSYAAPSAEDRAAYKSMVKKWMLESTSPTKYADLSSIIIISQTKQIVNDSSVIPRAAYIGNKQYPNMARAVHHRPGFVFGVSMSSDKVGNFEIVNEENLKGWHTGDGMTYLYNSDITQYKDSFWPTINSYRLPGTTVIQNSTATANTKNPNNWVGGTEISGLYGATGMQYTANGYNLIAKKSWFMFDDEVVSLGAGITSTDNKVVETIVENRKLNDSGNNALTVNGAAQPTTLGWSETMDGVNRIHLAGDTPGSDIGYYFPTTTTMNGLRESRTDNWASVNQYYQGTDYTTDYTRNYMNLWFDHGTNPTDGTYDYVLLPGKTSEEVDQYANHPDIEVLANTGNVQAVRENKLGITAINFWNDGITAVGPFTSNKKASVMIKKTEEDTEVSVSDPTMTNTGTIDLTLDTDFGDIVYLDPGVSLNHVDGKAKLTINVKDAFGKTFKVKFRLPGKKQAMDTPSGLTAVQNTANSVKLTWNGVDRAAAAPSAPTGLRVGGGTENSLTVEWDAVPGAADYRLYRSTSENGDYYSISDLPSGALSYTDTKLESGRQYYYKAAAMNNNGLSSYSTVASGWTVAAPPSGLKVVNIAGASITLAWNEVPGATEYQLYRSSSLTGEYQPLTGPSVITATYTDLGIAEGTNYYYKVAAMNPGGLSAPSTPISTLFNVSADVLHEDFDDMTRGELNGQRGWSATIPDGTVGGEITVKEDMADSANLLLKKQSTGDPVVSHTFSVPAGAYVTAEVTVNAADAQYKTVLDIRDSVAGKRAVNIIMQSGKIWGYSGSTKVDLLNPMDFNRAYRLKAVINTITKKFDMYVDDQLLGSNWSFRESPVNNLDTVIFALAGTASAMTLDDIKISYVPAAPTNLDAAERSGTGINLTWNSVTGATGYRLYRSQDPSVGFKQVAEVTSGNSYSDNGLTPKTNYYYKIVALSGSAVSEESSMLTTATTNTSGLDLPIAPSGLLASDYTGSSIKLRWQAGKDAASYSIFRSTTSGNSFEPVGNTTALSFVDSGLDNNTSYNYKVVSVNEEGVSPDSSIVSSAFDVVQTLIEDNFDDDGLGGNPAGWTIAEDTGRQVSVIDATGTAAPGHAVRVTGGNALETSAVRSFGDAQGVQGIVTVETLVQPTNANWKNIPVVLTPAGTPAVHVYFNSSQIFAYKSSSSSSKTSVFSPIVFDGTWYKTKLIINTNTNKFDLYVNDAVAPAASQFGFRTATAAVYGVKMAVDNVSSFDFDNVIVYYKPIAPTALAASSSTNSSIQLTWGGAAGASGYKLYRSSSANEGYQPVYSGSELTYTDTGLQSGTTYYYKVAATHGMAVSDASNMVMTSTTGSSIATLQSLKKEVRTLSVPQDPGQVGYILYRDGVEVSRSFNTFDIDSPLEAGRTYQYTIAAYDNLGHTSGVSLPVAYTVPVVHDDNNDTDNSGAGSDNGGAAPTNPAPETKPETKPETIPDKNDVFTEVVDKDEIISNLLKQYEEHKDDSVNFSDTKEHWASETIDVFARLGIIQGYEDQSVHPDGEITRAEFAVIVSRLFGITEGGDASKLSDTESHWAASAIHALASKGIVGGYEDGTFKPDAQITRAEIIAIISKLIVFKASTNSLNAFTDLDGVWNKDQIQAAADMGIIDGQTEGNFAPNRKSTRAEALTILLHTLQLIPELNTFLK